MESLVKGSPPHNTYKVDDLNHLYQFLQHKVKSKFGVNSEGPPINAIVYNSSHYSRATNWKRPQSSTIIFICCVFVFICGLREFECRQPNEVDKLIAWNDVFLSSFVGLEILNVDKKGHAWHRDFYFVIFLLILCMQKDSSSSKTRNILLTFYITS